MQKLIKQEHAIRNHTIECNDGDQIVCYPITLLVDLIVNRLNKLSRIYTGLQYKEMK